MKKYNLIDEIGKLNDEIIEEVTLIDNKEDLQSKKRKDKNMLLKICCSCLGSICLAFTCILLVNNIKKANSNMSVTHYNKYVDYFKDIDTNNSKRQDHCEVNWAYNVSDTKLVAKEADYIVKIKILDIKDGTYEYSNGNVPNTPIVVETLSVLKGDKKTKIKQILQLGGRVTINEYIKNNHPVHIQNMGLDKLSDEEKKSKYIDDYFAAEFDFEVGKTYVVALKESNGNYFLSANGYNVFEIKGSSYVNILTGNELILD